MGRLGKCKPSQAWRDADEESRTTSKARSSKKRPGRNDLWGKVHLCWAAKVKSGDAFFAAVIGYMIHRKKLTQFELSDELFRRYGFNRKTRLKALARFEVAGAVRVVRRGRKAPIVIVLPCEAATEYDPGPLIE
jgi:hypothetical protein